jgi:hypothetical protein
MGRIGGFGIKIHPDFNYANLYHWLLATMTCGRGAWVVRYLLAVTHTQRGAMSIRARGSRLPKRTPHQPHKKAFPPIIPRIIGVRFAVPLLCTLPLSNATLCKDRTSNYCNKMSYANDCDTMQVAEKG